MEDCSSVSETFCPHRKRKGSSLSLQSLQQLGLKKKQRLFRLSEWRDWSALPDRLLLNILDRLTAVDDYNRFGHVCRSWHRVSLPMLKTIFRSPFLLIAPSPDGDKYDERRALYSASNGRVYEVEMQLPHSKICCGSSFGWLVTAEQKGSGKYNVQLHNPIINRTFDLPPLDDILQHVTGYSVGGQHFLRKAVLSSDPSISSHNFMIMGIMSRKCGLGFFKPGNRDWTLIGCLNSGSLMYNDVIFFRSVGEFYALRADGVVFAVKFPPGIEEPKLKKVAPPVSSKDSDVPQMYLVEDLSTGDLLRVHKNTRRSEKDQNGKTHRIVQFHVFRFDLVGRKWIRIPHLGDKVLFIGNNCSILRSTLDCPGCEPNCIYYTDDDYYDIRIPIRSHKPPCAGIYNLEDDSVRPHYMLNKSKKMVPRTIWLEPNFS